MACGLCLGQAADDSRPASTNVRGAEYARVHPDCRVNFRLAAPESEKVQVRTGPTYDMITDAEGVWSVTIPPQVPGFHCWLVIDGAHRAGTGRDNTTSMLPNLDPPMLSKLRMLGKSSRSAEPCDWRGFRAAGHRSSVLGRLCNTVQANSSSHSASARLLSGINGSARHGSPVPG